MIMEIIREESSASRPPVLDGKNYSYWKPRMIFFIKTLDGRAWRALVAGYEPPMITVDGVSIQKPEVDWTDAEEQTSVGNAIALNAIFNGVDLKVSECNERVLDIANESLLLGEKIPDSKIVRKVLCSLSRKFDMKVTAIKEAHDITTLKLDELFGSLFTLEMTISNRENKKGKRITFKSIYEEETLVNQSDNEVNIDESIALLTKQFSKVVRKFKNTNTIESNAQNSNQYRRKDGKNTIRRYNVVSNRRDSDYGKEKEGEGRCFRCRECGVGHYQAECSIFLRRQKKNFRATLSDEDIDNSEDDNGIKAFAELKVLWKEDSEARAIQKERIQDLMEENEQLMSVISSLKLKSKEVQNDYDQTIKSVKMLNSGTEKLDSILNSGQNSSSKYGLGFDVSVKSIKPTTEIKFVPALVKEETETVPTTTVRKAEYGSLKHKSTFKNWNRGKRSRLVLRVKPSEHCNIAFTTVQATNDAWPMQTESLGGKKYVFVDVDDFSRFTSVRFLKGKSDTAKSCISLCLNLQCEKGKKISRIRSDHGKEFENEDLNNFGESKGIHYEFSAPRTP
ncbi:gag-proteinase polyprotein [Cucumis melo var. makuwa]|uniref:Gag-proteinase polyprotein n=1 Tax=Cucumis melo var. makuwa TaxID=1194695 RepID=A0A5A7T9Z9_CUCMM|nr:gag-proteinase polyprotein [Cucumis melo var. makuwa]